MGNWDLDCGGRLSTEEFEALRSLVLELNGGALPPNWGKSYIDWFGSVRGLSPGERRARLKALMASATPSAPSKKASNGPTLQTYTERYPNGQIKTQYTYYLSATGGHVQHGVTRMWRPNGKLSDEVSMVQGRIDGLWKVYYPTGELMLEQTYAHGKQSGPTTRYYPSGSKAEFGIYDDGQKDGLWTEWHENGQKKGEDEYQAGNRVRGKSKRWDDKGRPLQLVGDWYPPVREPLVVAAR
jgi:hypothetical protein